MRHTREILRQKLTLGRSHRAIAQSLGLSSGTVGATVLRARAAGLDWPQVEALTDDALEGRLYGLRAVAGSRGRPWPDCAALHAERRKPGVTLLHLEYVEQHPDGYRYTQFCEIYRRWLDRRGLSMRQLHHAGEKLFVDYSGQKPSFIDPATSERISVELFVAVLGASNYTYAEATLTQQVPDWIASHQRAFAFVGGVTAAIVCDQLKSGVVIPCRYEPGLQRTYEELAQHYGNVIVPARPAKARDKAKVEVAVQVVERWILARLRHDTFFSLAALNARIAELLADLNARPMRLYRASRRELFERLDQPAFRPLPAEPFVYGEWKTARVNVDYHVELHGHYYSVPYALVHEAVDVRASVSTVEIFHRGQRVGAHRRTDSRGRHTTDPAHMPKAHQRHLEWTPSRSSAGPRRSARRPPPSSRRSSPTGRIPSRAIARAWAFCVWPSATAPLASRPRAPGRAVSPPAPTAMSIPSSSTARSGRAPRGGVRPGAAVHARTRPWPAVLPLKEDAARMLTAPTLDKLQSLKLDAMAQAWTEQQQHAELTSLAFDERFGLLVDAEWLARDNKRVTRALKEAKLKFPHACLEAIDNPARRELDKAVIRQLATCRWVQEHHNVILVGATGTGKSFVACALAAHACRKGFRAYYRRASRLFHDLTLARADGTYVRLLGKLARVDVLLIDDWGLAPVTDQERRDLLEILEDRYGDRSTIITSQLLPALVC